MKFIRSIFKPIDLTEGKPWKVILLFAIPILLSTLLNNAFSLINALVLKITVGGTSVTSINQTGSITCILFNFAYGCSSGFAVIISNKFGSKDYEGLKKTFVNSIILSIIIAIVITILGLLIYPYLFQILGTHTDFIEKASNYLTIILIGFIFTLLANVFGNFLRGLGNSTTPLLISFICTIINIVLAFLFTGVIKLDTRGVALATIIANFSNFLITAIYFYKKYPYLRIQPSNIKLDKNIIFDLFKIGLPLGFQWSILFIGSFVQAEKVNAFGRSAQTAVSCYQPFEGYLTIPLSVLSTATLSFVVHNYGAQNYNRIKEGIKDTIILDLCFYFIILILGLSLASKVPYIFIPREDVNDEIIFYCATYLRILTPCLILQGLLQLSRSVLQGTKRAIIPFLSGIGELVGRILICLFIPSLINSANPLSNESYIGICFSTPVAWLISVIIMGGSVIYIVYKKNFNQ